MLEQYKLFVETSQHTSDKRQNANNYLLTLNSSLVTLFVALLSAFGHHRWNALIPATGLIVCFIWWSLVDSYKDLNTAKFAVIHELENQLPVALFRHEWFVCGNNRMKEDKPVEDRYVPLTHLERWIPVRLPLCIWCLVAMLYSLHGQQGYADAAHIAATATASTTAKGATLACNILDSINAALYSEKSCSQLVPV